MSAFRIAIALVICLLAALSGSSALAGELVDHATKAEGFMAAGKPVQALAEMEAAFNSVWAQAPLGFSEALFVSAPPKGFGLYDPRPTAIFKPGEPLMVYAEPYGYGYQEKDGLNTIAFSADFAVRDGKGLVLQEEKDFADLTVQSRRQNKEFQISLTFNLNGLKPGDYMLTTSLTDKASGKTGHFNLPFTIAD